MLNSHVICICPLAIFSIAKSFLHYFTTVYLSINQHLLILYSVNLFLYYNEHLKFITSSFSFLQHPTYKTISLVLSSKLTFKQFSLSKTPYTGYSSFVISYAGSLVNTS